MASKYKKYKTSFSDNFKEQHPFVTKCSSYVFDYQHKFHCTIYNVNISLAHGGFRDITRHAETPGHKKRASALKDKLILHSLSNFDTWIFILDTIFLPISYLLFKQLF